MKDIRIGKDIRVRLAVKTNGAEQSLEGRDLTVVLTDPLRAEKKVEGYSVSNAEIAFTYFGTEQKRLGTYRLTVWENFGKVGQTVLDVCDAFRLVATTCEEGGSDEGLDTEVVELSGDMQLGVQGLSAYEVAVKNGYVGTEEEWLESLNGTDGKDFTYEDFTPEQLAALQKPALDAAKVAEASAGKADTAAALAGSAAQNATRVEQAISAAEAVRVQAEKDRESAELNREQAEQARERAEQSRATAESGRVTAETARERAEQSRATEFARLKQESELATSNAGKAATSANEAADNANKAAQGIDGRMSEVYANFAAIEASGETNEDKIFIDAETNTSYRYDTVGKKFVSIGGGSGITNIQKYSPFSIIKGSYTGICSSMYKVNFGVSPIVITSYQYYTAYNKYQTKILLLCDEPVYVSVTKASIANINSILVFYISGYELRFINKASGKVIQDETINSNIISSAFNSKALGVCAVLDTFNKKAYLFTKEVNKPFALFYSVDIKGYSDVFNESYLGISPRAGGIAQLYQNYTVINTYLPISDLLDQVFSVGNYNICAKYFEKYDYDKELAEINSREGAINYDTKAVTVTYDEQTERGFIANIEVKDSDTSLMFGVSNTGMGGKIKVLSCQCLLKLKVLSGDCFIQAGPSTTLYKVGDNIVLEKIGWPSFYKLDSGAEYTLLVLSSNDMHYMMRYSIRVKASTTFKLQQLDCKVMLPVHQLCCMETFNGKYFEGNIPILTQGNDIVQATPLFTTGAKQNILGQQRMDTQGGVYITVIDSSGNYVEKKITQ